MSMKAVWKDGALVAPTLGFWRPAVSRGAHITGGTVLGTLERLGRKHPVSAPPGARGQVVSASASYVQYGDLLCELGALELGDESAAEEADTQGLVAVCTPMAGAVYLAPAPGEPAFVQIGQTVQRNATVALVEVMKTFTPLKAPQAGTVRRFDVSDGDAVEADAVVLWLAEPGQ